MSARPTVRVVIVNWRNPALTLRAARSVAPQLGSGDHLVLVDNGSGDDSVAVIGGGLDALRGAAAGARVSLVESPVNAGFGAGVAAGAEGADEDAIALLNNDAIVDDGYLDALLAPLGTTRGGAEVGATTALILLSGTWRPLAPGEDRPHLVARDGARWTRLGDDEAGAGAVLVNSTGNLVDASGNGYDRDWLSPARGLDAPADVFGVCGGACAVSRRAWEAVGGIRTDLFMYYEDTDLSWRLREHGWAVVYVREAVVLHEHASSSGTSSAMFIRVNARNRILVAAAHSPAPVVMQALARTVVRGLRGPRRGAVMTGLAQAVARLPRELRRRTREHTRHPSRNR